MGSPPPTVEWSPGNQHCCKVDLVLSGVNFQRVGVKGARCSFNANLSFISSHLLNRVERGGGGELRMKCKLDVGMEISIRELILLVDFRQHGIE